MPGFDVISEIFGQFAPVEQIDTERQIAFVESQVGDLLKAEAGGAGADEFLEAVLNFAKAMFEICCKIFALYIKEHFG